MTKIKSTKKNIAIAGVLLAVLGVAVGLVSMSDTGPNGESQSKDERMTHVEYGEVSEELEIHYLDVGQGDSTLIICGEDTMLIDAGDNSQGDNVADYLEYMGISQIDYLVGTHPDADHIGGLDVILYNYQCDTVMMPDEAKDTNTYEDVIEALHKAEQDITLPEVGKTYKLGEGEFTIIAPNRDYSDANNSSIGILLSFGDNKFLFTGDAEHEAEADIIANGIDISADVYKAGHHGSRTASSEEFLERVSPEAVVVSCGEDNSYGHPHADITNYCLMNKIPMYRTDMQGTIVLTSNGTDITWNMSPYEPY